MALSPNFPTNPYTILDPDIRWYPGEEDLQEKGYEMLLPPLVYKIRKGVQAWRKSGYQGASETTKALLNYWFNTEHFPQSFVGELKIFSYYFSQREAVESAIWLYEVEQARDPYALLKYDSSDRISKGMFIEDWTRYVMKLATGAGKTKVISLLIAWSYFHKRYELDSDLSTNFLLIAPNIIVLDRLLTDFDGLKIFYQDPILPDNGYQGQNWQDDFQLTLHVQDEIGVVSDTGNLFLSNIHRVFQNNIIPSLTDDNVMDYFLGKRPKGKTNETKLDLGEIIRTVPDLVVINDEAHHIHDEKLAWFQNIQDISNQLRLKGSKLSVQLDLTATPRHNNGAIFVQTISDYPLVEAIRQGVTKTPVLPDGASRAKLQEKQSAKYTEQYEDYLHLGYLEWKKRYEELLPTGKKSVLFIMTDDTKNCDEVAEFLERRYPELDKAVLVIHTKKNGEIDEKAQGKNKEELEKLRQLSRDIDEATIPYKAIVSVMVLREGWDVKNIVSIVGLRPYKAKSKILPEQTLGRGLRLMFRGDNVAEYVSIIGTEAFMDFVSAIKLEGVELQEVPMGEKTQPKSPLVIEVDRDKVGKSLENLDIEMPILTPRIQRDYKNLEVLNPAKFSHKKLAVRKYTAEQQREIIFLDIDTGQMSHITTMDSNFEPNYQSAIGYFAKTLMRDLRLVNGFDILFGKIKGFIEKELFLTVVKLNDPNLLRNLSELDVTRTIIETFKAGINALTVQDKGTTQQVNQIKLSETRPYIVSDKGGNYLVPKRSIFNKIVTDNNFELEFAAFLDNCDIISFVKNSQSVKFKIEYQTAEGSIANYYPDFIVKETEQKIWVIETKGREDLEDVEKWKRLQQWCEDATVEDKQGRCFYPLYVKQEQWEKYRPKTFKQLQQISG
jgi:type III restriction enzyme